MTNIWKMRTFKTNPPALRYAVVQQKNVVKYFSKKDQCQQLLKHLRAGGGFSGEIPRYMMKGKA